MDGDVSNDRLTRWARKGEHVPGISEAFGVAMTSIVIAAHNEATVIGLCLDTLLADARPGEFDVTVVANGCVDDTAVVAARPGVRVVEVSEASKPKALNAGDDVALGFPRIYLDADIVVTADVPRALCEVLTSATGDARDSRPLAAVPRRDLDLTGRPWPVRHYFSINSRLPAFRDGLFGRGMIALSAEGRARFDRFPDMVSDDLFLDSQFDSAAKRQVNHVATVVAAPYHTRDLVRRLIRVRRGNSAMRAAGRTGEVAVDIRPSDRFAWLRDVVVPHPRLAPAALSYLVITGLAAVKARRVPDPADAWGRDESTRRGRGRGFPGLGGTSDD
ncbi:glycosyltransferase [Rhodococcus sp. NPDC127528]|uniref:glycosyltransferase n=1 Tax=unclassified Rhodococcus (in: high G+C Gram-positive bacteria) TaxID=192944 RepID=UPI003636964F